MAGCCLLIEYSSTYVEKDWHKDQSIGENNEDSPAGQPSNDIAIAIVAAFSSSLDERATVCGDLVEHHCEA